MLYVLAFAAGFVAFPIVVFMASVGFAINGWMS